MSTEKTTAGPFLSETVKLFNLIGELEEQTKRAENESNTARHDMKEIKHSLACLSGLGKILQRAELELDRAVQEILDLIPLAWQHPDETAARIIVEGREYKTSNFIVETEWRFASDIFISGEPRGVVEVFYLEDKAPDFAGMQMWESGEMIGAFAAGIGLLFERHRLTRELNSRVAAIKKLEQTHNHNSARLTKAIAKLKSMKEQCDSTEHRMHWLLARISSELRTMLAGVTNIVGKGLESSADEASESLRQIRAEAEHMIMITNRICDYAQVSNGRFRHNNTEFRLRAVIENAIDQFLETAQKKEIEPIIIVDPFVPDRVIGDGNRLSQILTYLMENALTRSGSGEIIVRVNVEVSAHMLPVFHFAIIDCGRTIPKESGNKLFDLCSDDDDSVARRGLYARLGAATAKHMVEVLGGEIWVENRNDETEGNAINFTMWLDVIKDQSEITGDGETDILSGTRILVAETSQSYCELYRLSLEYWGAEPTIVSTGREALEQIKQAVDMNSPFAAVIIDGALPDMDGMKVVERIRAEVPTESPATIMTTSGEWPPDEGRSRAAGISAILGKPVRQPALQEALTAVILNKTKAVDTRREESHHEAVAPVPAEAAESGGEATANEPSEEKSEPAGEHAPKQMIESVGTEFPVQKVESTGEESPAEKDETAGDDMSEHKVESAGEELPEQKVESASAEQPEQKVESIVQESSRDNIETAGNDIPEHKIESAGEEPPEQEVESVSAELPAQKVESIGEESPAKSDETAGEVASEQKAESAGQELPIQKVESASEDRSEQKVESTDKESHVQKVNSAPEDSSGEATASAPDESPGESAPATKDNAQTPRKLVAKQVLLFDAGDDARRAITAKLLHKHGLEVSTVKTGQEVLEKLVSGKYDIAFFDPVMPGPDGVDVANKFRHSKRINGSRVPLVVIIPEDGKLNRKAFRDAGIDDFLEQPIELTRMIELIETHCGAKQTAGKTKAEQAQPLMRFDREKALAMVNGDSEMLTDVIEIFEDVCESCLAALDASLKSSDYGKVIDLAGKIRKAASDVGAMKISRMGEQLSTLSLPDSLDIAQEISETLRQEFAEFRKIAAMFARSTMA